MDQQYRQPILYTNSTDYSDGGPLPLSEITSSLSGTIKMVTKISREIANGTPIKKFTSLNIVSIGVNTKVCLHISSIVMTLC